MTAIARAPDLGARIWRTAARGVALVGAAVVVGIILVQVVNGSGSPTSGSAKTGTSTSAVGGTTTTTRPAGRPASQVKIAVYNASGISQAATTHANELRGLGYAIVFTGNAATVQTGTTIACKAGLATEADVLAKAVAVTATVGIFPNPPPATAAMADCIVNIGK